jgi:nucleolar protein 14
MPPSQLKRLKASLREQGLSNQQKSKKQKKQAVSTKSTSERNNRAAALQQIRDSFNPFEHKSISSRPEKFSSTSISNRNNGAGGGYKAVLHRPGVSKSRGEEMRRDTLLPEMRRRNKVGGLVDRRIGEGDVDMTPEERAVQRFAREKERKAKGRGMFDLEGSDDEGGAGGGLLTHGGKRVEDLVADDFQDESIEGSGSEDDGEELFTRKRRRDSDEEGEEDEDEDEAEGDIEGQPERKKTKKEVMHELIAKSKMHKYERQKVKEDDDDLREELDKGFGEILGLLQGVKKPPPPPKTSEPAAVDSNGPIVNPDRQKLLDGMERSQADKDYDIRMKQLATDTRAKPSDRAKTEEEKAADEAERLRKLEEKRLKRMRGEDLSDDEKAGKGEKGDGVEDDGLDAVDGEEDYGDDAADFGFTASAPPAAKATKSNEHLVLDDEDEFALDEDLVASGSDAGLSDVESGESSEDDSDIDMDNHEDEEDEFIQGILGPEDGSTSKGPEVTGANAVAPGTRLAYTYPCPRSHEELLNTIKDVPTDQLITVIQRIRALYHPSLSEANKESMADFSRSLVEHLSYMGNEKQPLAVTEQVIRHLHSLSRTYPSQIGEAFRTQLKAFHERGHPTAGDFVMLTAIGSIYPTSDHWHQVVTPATTIMAKWLGLNVPSASKSVDPKILTNGAFLVAMCINYQRLSKRLVPEAVRFTLRALAVKNLDPAVLTPHLTNLVLLADLYAPLSAFTELFTPFLPVLKSIPNAKSIHSRLRVALSASRISRRPLELHHHKPNPIRTSVPKFEEAFNPDKHYDPDKERSDSKKLAAEYKRERKGAIRELRKDANFMAREMLREKKEADAAYEKKYRRLVAEVQGEAAQGGKEWEREKARNERQKFEAKKKKGGR